jgi:hypothetical protein
MTKKLCSILQHRRKKLGVDIEYENLCSYNDFNSDTVGVFSRNIF